MASPYQTQSSTQNKRKYTMLDDYRNAIERGNFTDVSTARHLETAPPISHQERGNFSGERSQFSSFSPLTMTREHRVSLFSLLGLNSPESCSAPMFHSSGTRVAHSDPVFPSSGINDPFSAPMLPLSGMRVPRGDAMASSSETRVPYSDPMFPLSGISVPSSSPMFSSSGLRVPCSAPMYPPSETSVPYSASLLPSSGTRFPSNDPVFLSPGMSFPYSSPMFSSSEISAPMFPSSGRSVPYNSPMFSSSELNTPMFPSSGVSVPYSAPMFSSSGIRVPHSSRVFPSSGIRNLPPYQSSRQSSLLHVSPENPYAAPRMMSLLPQHESPEVPHPLSRMVSLLPQLGSPEVPYPAPSMSLAPQHGRVQNIPGSSFTPAGINIENPQKKVRFFEIGSSSNTGASISPIAEQLKTVTEFSQLLNETSVPNSMADDLSEDLLLVNSYTPIDPITEVWNTVNRNTTNDNSGVDEMNNWWDKVYGEDPKE
ncbi:uncharacterized protein LOC144574165 isoform X3 [Carex rostrata]